MKRLFNYNSIVLNVLSHYNTFETMFYMKFIEHDNMTECCIYDSSMMCANTELATIQIFNFDNDTKSNVSYIALHIIACSSNDNDTDIIDTMSIHELNNVLYGESSLTGELVELAKFE